MRKTCRNMYRDARVFAGMTIEQAAEQIGVASRTLAGYELGEYVPSMEVVSIMCEVYCAGWLAYQHLQGSNQLGKRYLPEVDFSDLPMMVLRFQKEMTDTQKVAGDMIEVACDGRIDKHELETWNIVSKEVEKLVGAGVAIMYARQKEKAPAFARG